MSDGIIYILLLLGPILSRSFAAIPSSNERIVGGSDFPIYNAPWQVSIQVSARHVCGGAIYTQQIILTAAHCVADQSSKLIQVRVGSSQYNSGGTLMPVAAYLLHESYHPQHYQYDIAVVRLASTLAYSLSIKAINLASITPAHGASATVSGWGKNNMHTTSYSSQLQSAQLQIITRDECASNKYGYGWDFVTLEMICAAAIGRDACEGDSGGPLVSGGVLVGLVSWGYGCALTNYPGVYADVAVLRPWIVKAANEV